MELAILLLPALLGPLNRSVLTFPEVLSRMDLMSSVNSVTSMLFHLQNLSMKSRDLSMLILHDCGALHTANASSHVFWLFPMLMISRDFWTCFSKLGLEKYLMQISCRSVGSVYAMPQSTNCLVSLALLSVTSCTSLSYCCSAFVSLAVLDSCV